MAINKSQQTNNNFNKPKATGWLRPRLIIRDPKTNEIVDSVWICADVPLYSNDEETNEAGSMVANSRQNPDYVYELQATVNVAKDPATLVQRKFA